MESDNFPSSNRRAPYVLRDLIKPYGKQTIQVKSKMKSSGTHVIFFIGLAGGIFGGMIGSTETSGSPQWYVFGMMDSSLRNVCTGLQLRCAKGLVGRKTLDGLRIRVWSTTVEVLFHGTQSR